MLKVERGEALKGLNFKRTKKKARSNLTLRFNILTVLTYMIGIILIIQLFNLQIVHGAEYREESNTRLTRETTLEAARGEILDRTEIEQEQHWLPILPKLVWNYIKPKLMIMN